MESPKRLALIISINDKYNYSIRTKYLAKVLGDFGYDVVVISSDFDHRTKKHYQDNREGLIQLSTKPYTKNLSVGRIISLIDFSHKALKKVEEFTPNLIYVSGPPNNQYKCFAKYKRKHPKVIVGAEVGDMWPESLPISEKLKKLAFIPMKIWSSLRDNYLGQLDFVVTECKLFETMLSRKVVPEKLRTIYFCKDDKENIKCEKKMDFREVNLAYVGSVNNIIDIDLISDMVSAIHRNKKVRFHLIGAGENKVELCEMIKNTCAELCDYGEVYDARRKAEILSQCMFAFNVMKTSVCVGMTMKSLDYFQYGIPILNNIRGDIWDIIESDDVGFNFDSSTIQVLAKRLCNMDRTEWNNLSKNTLICFSNKFSTKTFEKQMQQLLDRW